MIAQLMTLKNNKRRPLTILAIVTALVFFRCLFFDFVPWDDDVNVYNNSGVTRFAWYTWIRYWTGTFQFFYAPVLYTTWAFIAAISPFAPDTSVAGTLAPHPFLFHAANLFFHVANVALVYLWIETMLDARKNEVYSSRSFTDSEFANRWAIAAACTLFAFHPIQVEAVAWVSGFRDVFSTFWSLVAILAFLRFAKGGNTRWYAGASVAFVLALLIKPSSAVVPILAALCSEYARFPRSRLVYLLPWVGASLLIAGITSQAHSNHASRVPFSRRLFKMLDSSTFALVQWLFPKEFTIRYGNAPEHSPFGGNWRLFSWLAPALLLSTLYRTSQVTRTNIGFGALFAAVCWFPVSGIFPIVSQNTSWFFDRYLYFASAGIAFSIAWVLRERGTRTAFAIFYGFAAFWAVRSFEQNEVWTNGVALFDHQNRVGIGEERYKAIHESMLLKAQNAAKPPKQERRLTSEPQPKVFALLQEGKTLFRRNNPGAAESRFLEALKLDPQSTEILVSLGDCAAMLNRQDDALSYYLRSLRILPNDSSTLGKVARIYIQEKNWKEALTYVDRTLELQPGSTYWQVTRKQLKLDMERANSKRVPSAHTRH